MFAFWSTVAGAQTPTDSNQVRGEQFQRLGKLPNRDLAAEIKRKPNHRTVATKEPRNVSERLVAPKTAALNEPTTQPVTTKNCSAAPAAVTTKPLPAGRMEIDISAPCHPEAIVKVGYSEFTFLNQLDTAGHGRILLDAFLPNIRTAVVSLPGNDTRQVPIVTRDQDRITKTAVIWNAPVNLDIHALEYAALRGQAGHVWAKSASTAEAALRKTDRTDKGRGFLTILDGATDAASTR
ncbi:MAG: hypothetical protein AAFV69_04905, partial [Pseudomonadota bacterium]